MRMLATSSPNVHLAPPFVQRRLVNGLTVIVEERHTTPVAAVNLWYDVGSRHEADHQKGLAHLFEHLMFQGSRNVAAGEHAGVLESVGARFNATTSFDRTNYFETVPVNALSTALWLEADRMATLREALSEQEFEAQRDVVKNERLQTYVEVPYGESMTHLMAALLPAGHPYATLPIGDMAHLDAATLEDLRSFFDTHYAPDNAVLTVVGDVDPENVFARAEEFFGGIPAGRPPAATPVDVLPPLSDGPTTTVVARVPYPAVFRGWRIPALTDDAFLAFEIAARVLGQGNGSRLRSGLVREQSLAIDVQAYAMGLAAGNSVLGVNAFVAEGVAPERVVDAVDEHIAQMLDRGLTDDEFASAVARHERDVVEAMSTSGGRADALSGAHTIHGDAARADQVLDRLRTLTAEAVVEALQSWLTPLASATVVYQPPTEEG